MNDRAAWLAARRTGVGGSDIAAIVGLSPWRTPLDVYLDKRGELPEQERNAEAMYWGTVLEDVVAREYTVRARRRIQRVNQLLRHPQREWQLANIDRAIVNPDIAGNVRWRDGRLTTDRLLECKTANAFAVGAWGEPGTDAIPEYYLTQVQWYMDVTSAEVCDVAVLIGGQEFRLYTVARDAEIIAALVAAADEFWRNLEQGIAPPPQSEADARRLWPRNAAGKRVIVDVTVADACRDLAALADEEKALEARRDELRTVVLAALGDAEEAQYMGRKLCTWRNNKDTHRVNWEGVARELGSIAGVDAFGAALGNHTETKPGARVLRLATTKE